MLGRAKQDARGRQGEGEWGIGRRQRDKAKVQGGGTGSKAAAARVSELARQVRLWAIKWRWYERNSLPWNRAAIHWEMMRREAFVRWPVHGNVLEALREGRLEIGAHTLLEPGVWITVPGAARVRIGAGTFLNMGVMVAAERAGRDRRSLHARQRLLRLRRLAPLRRSRASRSPGRGSRARVRPGSATTVGSGRMWSSRAASRSASAA